LGLTKKQGKRLEKGRATLGGDEKRDQNKGGGGGRGGWTEIKTREGILA